MARHRYKYTGPVTSFGRLVAEDWTGETMAETKAKAKSNLIYRCKRDMHMLPSAKIEFSGVIEKVTVDVHQVRSWAL